MAKRVRTYRVEDELWEAAKEAAAAEGMTMTDVIESALTVLVEHHRAASDGSEAAGD